MRSLSLFVARPRLAATIALCGAVLSTSTGCGTRGTEEPGAPFVTDRPVALLSASQNDLTATELYLVSENGVTAMKVPTFTGPKWQVRWSGDGRRIAITGNTLGAASDKVTSASDVWVLNADGTDLRQITHDGLSDSPSWLEDGRLVYAYRPAAGAAQWFAVPASGGAPVAITLRNGQPVHTPDWSRAGSQMTFTEDAIVYTASVDGTSERALASGVLPRWSPTGDRIACISGSNAAPRLLSVRVDGQTRPTVVADLSNLANAPRGLAWSPDGSRIAWVRPTATSMQAVVSSANGASLPVPLVQRAPTTVAFDVDVDWRPTTLVR